MKKAKNELEIVKANALVEASYRLSVAEQRIILACIAQVRRDKPLTDEVMYSVSVEDIAQLSGRASKSLYSELAETSERLFQRRVTFHEAPNGRGKPRVRVTRWVQTVNYIEKEGRVELRFNKDMVPYLSRLTEQFTRYALSNVAKMTSHHAIRLYELLMQWQTQGAREIPLAWLQDALGLKDYYSTFAGFRRRVIEPSLEQINTLTPLTVTYTPVKTGRRITALFFEWTLKEAPKKGKKQGRPAKEPLSDAEMAAQAKPGETWAQLRARLTGAR